jgi:uncharacterized protein
MLGACAGIIAGLLGVGGGLIIVPILSWIFRIQHIEDAIIMHLSIGSSLATIFFTSIFSVRAHHRLGTVLWPTVLRLTPGIVLGSQLGALFVDCLSSFVLQKLFAVFALAMSIQMEFGVNSVMHRRLPSTICMLLVGSVIGAFSTIVGIGGGSLTVPFLTWCNVSIRHAVATSAACGLPIALAGSISFILIGLDVPNLPTWSVGYIHLPALIGIVTTSVFSVNLGAKLTHVLPTRILKRLFSIFLAAVGTKMLV